MMNYLYLQSQLQTGPELAEKAASLFQYLSERTGDTYRAADAAQVAGEPVSVVYVASGGTAGAFRDALSSLKEPILIITSGSDNSLSASMEMMTYLANLGLKGRLLHGSQEEIATTFCHALNAAKTRHSLHGMRLGLVGKPSDWLISTEMNYDLLKEKTGIEVVEIGMPELLEEIAKQSYPDSEICRSLLDQDFDTEQVKQALEIYGAFSRLVERYHLNGFSVRCFDLLTAVKNTGCLGLALLNQEGIYSGCEGDLPSLISMAILGEISGQPVFQCNPSRADSKTDDIIFAHCTLPLNMPVRYHLDTHFESGIGVAIAGDIPPGRATVFKATGMLDRCFISGAEIEESLHECDLCRSQIRLHCDAGVNQFFHTPVGNHYLVCMGDYAEDLREFIAMF
ncbi:hypothetical protein [Clostridium sp. AM58-1XD]|uniref:hypothetical protein n=1 Tax=Clostridium sp. AM58-1XD TaxID=2292307 RepID=UPI000E4E2D82|nr:hypothetical protein [Clostridium sp. AM58-1XD]RGY96185.1 hypothetical protein DXA13_17670 [Clostridium sp. AM58-1XD]